MSNSTLCRICLEDGAIYPIFDDDKREDCSVYSKLSLCFREKVEDIEGYPRNICETCNNTLESLFNFIHKYKASCKLLQSGLHIVKKEATHDSDYSYNDLSEVEIEISKTIKEEPEADFNENFDDELEPLIKLKLIAPQLKIKRIKNTKIKKRSEIKINKVKQPSKSVIKYKTNTIASSILEGEFSWTGEKWCISNSTTIIEPKKVRSNREKDLKKEIKVKLKREKIPPPPKLCDMCGEVFKTQDRLSYHKRKIHYKQQVKCPECSRIFPSEYCLSKHVKRKHTGEKNFICSACGKRFAFKGELTSHNRKVHSNNSNLTKKVHKCKICDKTYKCAKSVVIHERSVHTGERPATCTICNTSFYHEDYLKEHMRLHTGETPFKCPICGRGYAQRCNMKSHLRIHRISELDAVTLSKLRPAYIKRLKV